MRQARCGTIPGLSLCLALVVIGINPGTTLAQPSEQDPGNLVPAAAPIEMCSGLTTRPDRVSVKPVARPPLLRAFKEPGFGTRTMRITNSAFGEVNKPAGKPAQAWNSDESLLLLHQYRDKHELILHDGRSYQAIRILAAPVNDSEDLFWSQSDPDLMYLVAQTGPQQGKLLEYNVNSEEQTILKDFAPLCSKAGLDVDGGRLARPSSDEDLFAYRCSARSEKSLVLSYRRSIDTVSSLAIGNGTSWPLDAVPQPFASGANIWFAGEILDDSLAATGIRFDMADHLQELSIGQDHNRQDAVYQSPTSVSPKGCTEDGWRGLGLVVEHLMPTENCRSIITQSDGYPQTPNPEIFASAHERPQWVAMSNMGYDGFDSFLSRTQAPLLFSEILIVNTEPEVREVCRLAHHRSFGKQASNGGYAPDLGEPNVTQSPSGTRVLFSTDWYDSGFVDTYVIELPAYTPHDLAGRWIDSDNQRVVTEFSQEGQKFSFLRTFAAANINNTVRTVGSGKIAGTQLDVTYTILLGNDRDIPGSCSGEIIEPGKVSLQCKDHYYGRVAFTLQRP